MTDRTLGDHRWRFDNPGEVAYAVRHFGPFVVVAPLVMTDTDAAEGPQENDR